MTDANDITLLREFAERESEPAFAEIVRRHLNLVYSVALRFTRDSEDAQDVAQAVFILLAQRAASLRERSSLTGWFYETTRFTAMKFIRTRARRAAREREAATQSVLNDATSENLWQRLEPFLEEAMSRLSEKDRELIALHFFDSKSPAETAAALGIAEWATRKRVARVVEKLRAFFTRRGVSVSGAVLVTAISVHSVQAAPDALAKTVTLAAVAKGSTVSASTLTLIKGAVKLMAWTKMKTAAIVGAVALLAVGTTTTVVIQHQHHRRAAETLQVTGAQNGDASAPGLQGRWKGSNTAHPGQECTLNISGDKIEYRGAERNDWLRGTFVLNGSANPKQLDVTILEPARSFVHCIYQADGNGITIAAAEHGSPLRPVDFTPSPQVDVLELQHD
jgi:RNA polymerase sigma factor (sigma-70 family)